MLGGGRKVSAQALVWFISELESLRESLSFSFSYTCNKTETKCLTPLSLPSRARGWFGANSGDDKLNKSSREILWISKQTSRTGEKTGAAALQDSAEQRANTKLLLNTCCGSVQLTGNNVNSKQQLGCVKTHTHTRTHKNSPDPCSVQVH